MDIKWIFVVFLLLVVFSVRKTKNQAAEVYEYTKSVTDSIKGVAAILIVLHHVSWKLDEANRMDSV